MRIYRCRTDQGIADFTEEDLWQFGTKIVKRLLNSKYPAQERYHDDLLQEAMCAIYKSMDSYNSEKGTLNGFVYGTANRAIAKKTRDIARQKCREVGLTDALLAATGESDNYDSEDDEAFEKMLAEFEKTLNKSERKALEMKLGGASNVEIYNALHPRYPRKRIGQAMTTFWDRIGLKYIKFKRTQK